MTITNKQRGLAVLLEWKDAQIKRSEGITEACDFIIDLKRAIDNANLTEIESKVIDILFSGDYPRITQTQMARDLGTYQKNISRAIYSSVEKIGESVLKVHEKDYDYLAKIKLIFDVVATESVYIGIEEIKRIPCVINGAPPEGYELTTYSLSSTARCTDLVVIQRKFDGTITLANLACGDDYCDDRLGRVDGTIFDLDGEEVEYTFVPSVDYMVEKGDVIAKVEVSAYVDKGIY